MSQDNPNPNPNPNEMQHDEEDDIEMDVADSEDEEIDEDDDMNDDETPEDDELPPPAEEDAAVQRRRAIQEIMRDTTLSDQEKSMRIQNLMSNNRLSVAPPPAPVLPAAEQANVACVHYERNCNIVAPCCQLVFGCRICHDDCPVLPPPLALVHHSHQQQHSFQNKILWNDDDNKYDWIVHCVVVVSVVSEVVIIYH